MVFGMSASVGCLLVTPLPVRAELARRPELLGRPVIIAAGGAGRRGVVDVSREARDLGARSGQLLTEALSRCAHAVALTADNRYYEAVNGELLAGLLETVDRVEPAGWGRCYLDLKGLAPMYGGKAPVGGDPVGC